LECKYHSGQEADLICMQCGQPYCRECVKETREAHCCPDCHRASVERLAAQMGGRKEAKPVKEPKPPKEPKEPKEKKLRKPAEVPLGPTLEDLSIPPPQQPAPPPPSLSPAEKAEFWGDKPSAAPAPPPLVVPPAVTSPPPPPAAPPARPRQQRPVQAAPGKPVQPLNVEGLPPPIVPVEAPGAGGKRKSVVKRPLMSKEEREAAVMASEGFPTAPPAGRGKKEEAAPGEPVAGEEELVPKTRRVRTKQERGIKKRREPANIPVAMQVPMDYDGEVTSDPTYFKAVLFAMGVGLVLAGAYAGVAFWLHKDLGIFGWVIGFAVGLMVVLGSGRHFSWRLGVIAAAIALFWISIARIAYGMLDVRFNDILPLKLGIWQLFTDSFNNFGKQFASLWLLFFIITGLVAFLVAFRPPPIKLQLAGTETGRVARKSA